MLDLNKIYNIDCREGFKLLDDKSIDIHFVSPPYGRKRNDKYSLFDDNIDWYKLVDTIISESLRILKDEGYLFLNIQKNYYNKKDYFKLIGKYADFIVEEIIWGKNNPMPANGLNITNSYEVILVINPKYKPLKAKNTYTKNLFMTNVNTNKYKSHKAVMNIEACRYLFNQFIPNNSIVLDSCSGLGTTFVVAKEFGCDFIGFELHQEYIDIALDRLK